MGKCVYCNLRSNKSNGLHEAQFLSVYNRTNLGGTLITTRFVTHPIEHGMAPINFWDPRGPGAVF
jgi:hypothetical protein